MPAARRPAVGRPWILASIALVSMFSSGAVAQTPGSPLQDGTIILSEFFEEVFRIDPGFSTGLDILNSPTGTGPFGQQIEIVSPTRVIISDFGDLFEYNGQASTTLVASLPSSPSDIVDDGNGGLVAVTTSGLFSVDLNTGAQQLIFDDSLFGPSDAVFSGDGLIYVTEFFDGLNVIDPVTGSRQQIGNFGSGEFAHLDIGPDGFLYAATSLNGDFLRINPVTGASTLVGSANSAFIGDLQVDDNGQLLFGGDQNGVQGIFSLDPATGSISTLFDGGDTFFSVQDFDVARSTLRTAAVPEPSTLAPMMLVLLAGLGRRRSRV